MAGKSVCKFFLQGRCKFGADCRNYHPTGNSSSNSTGWGNSRTGGYGHSNRYQLFSDSDSGGGSYQNKQYGERRSPFDRLGLGGKSNNPEGRPDQWKGQSQWNTLRGGQNQWNTSRGGQNQWNTSRGGQNQWNTQRGGQNQWNTQRGGQDRWNTQRGGQNQWSNQKGGQNQWNTPRRGQNQWNTQRGGQDRWSGSKQWASKNDQPTSPEEIAEMIRVDMEEWVTSKMWPLSCYAYAKETQCLEGFSDVSMEELRWEAYQANSSGNSAKYLQSLNELGERHMEVKKRFSSITTADVQSMQSGALFGGSTASSLFGAASQSADMSGPSPLFGATNKSSLFAPSPAGPSVSSLFGVQSVPSPGRSVTLPPQALASADVTRSVTQPPSAAAPPSPQHTTNPAHPSLEDIINFTKTRGLTKDEVDAYNVDKFVLGNIPEHVPPVI